MKKQLSTIGVMLLMSVFAIAQDAAKKPEEKPATPPPPKTVSEILDRQVSTLERELVPLVEAMPEEKFGFAPSGEGFKGVRTFQQQVGHVAANNFLFAAALTGDKPTRVTAEQGETGPTFKSKAEAVQYLKDSFAEAHRGVATVNEKNATELVVFPFSDSKSTRLGLANIIAWHGFDDYGQLVEYLRMNNIIPPASR